MPWYIPYIIVKTGQLLNSEPGAQLMTNLSELIVRSQQNPSSKTLHQAETWAKKALDIAMHSKESTSAQHPTCEIAFAVALFNIAALRRVRHIFPSLLQMSNELQFAIDGWRYRTGQGILYTKP